MSDIYLRMWLIFEFSSTLANASFDLIVGFENLLEDQECSSVFQNLSLDISGKDNARLTITLFGITWDE